ncbi:hypothetical protein [Planobispora takensis]|uniref:Uncharacterized protein n=1 Tax=Planobispora takensis TaxID=1367882 RepID=A0A8J3WQ59_9ACTN|nr:hypothetical protein [Planobispora takensis]GIH98103.1 hypothetical protein Pta02_01120 [Planobispora takensis]
MDPKKLPPRTSLWTKIRVTILVVGGITILLLVLVNAAIYEDGGSLPPGQLVLTLLSLGIGVLIAEGMRREGRQRLAQVDKGTEDPRQALRYRIDAVNTAFTEAARLMDDLKRDLAAQQAAREALLAQAEEQERLLEFNQEQAEKIRQILVGETKATIRAERRQQWMFFALGVLASIPIGVAINLLVP